MRKHPNSDKLEELNCLRCGEKIEKRKLFLTHYTFDKGEHDVCLCEDCFLLLPLDLAKEVKKSSLSHENTKGFNKIFIEAFGTKKNRCFDFNDCYVILYKGTDFSQARYKYFRREKEFVKALSEAFSKKVKIYALYDNGKMLSSKEVETLLGCHFEEGIIG